MSDHATQRRQRLAGIGLMCATVALFACLDTTAKYLNTEFDVLEIAWARYTSAFLLTLIVVNPIRHPEVLKTANLKLQVIRAFLLIGSTVFNFVALRWMQLDEVLSITFTFPFIVAIASIPLLGETIGWRRWSAICFGFCGVLVITRPGFTTVHPAALFALTATLCYGFYAVTTRILSRTDSSVTTLLYANAIGALVMSPIVLFVWQTPSNWKQVGLMTMTGVLGTVGHYCLIVGHRFAPASVLAPFIYTQLIWVVILGYVVFDHVPTAWTMGGASMVIGSGLYMIWRERKLGKTTTSEGALEGPRD